MYPATIGLLVSVLGALPGAARILDRFARVRVWLELDEDGTRPGFRRILGALAVANVGAVPVSVVRAGLVDRGGRFVRNEEFPRLPLAVPVGGAARIVVDTPAELLAGAPIVGAVELHNGWIVHAGR